MGCLRVKALLLVSHYPQCFCRIFLISGCFVVEGFMPPKRLTSQAFGAPAAPALSVPMLGHQMAPPPLLHNPASNVGVGGPVSTDALATWAQTAATVTSNPTTGDGALLNALGDCLSSNKWTEAAHVW